MHKLRIYAVLLAAGMLLTTGATPEAGVMSVHPVVNRYGYLTGGTINGKWARASRIARCMHGGERYRLYSGTKYVGTAVGEKPDSNYFIDFQPSKNADIAISGDWNALPRQPKEEKRTSGKYKNEIRQFIKTKGLSDTAVNISRIISVDLENDGQNEAIISASSDWDPSNYRTGQYSIVLVRKIVKGQIKLNILAADIHAKPSKSKVPIYYTIDGAWDMDGDGKLEIAVNYSCPLLESYGTSIYRMRNNKQALLSQIRPNLDYKISAAPKHQAANPYRRPL